MERTLLGTQVDYNLLSKEPYRSRWRAVTLALQLCGSSATTTQVGINWEIDVSIATCVLQEISTYDVKITATDESGVESTLEINVKIKRPRRFKQWLINR